MANYTAIVAAAHNHTIGDKGRIPWYVPCDLRHFREVTADSTIIVGRKTQLPDLPGREIIRLSRQSPDIRPTRDRVFVAGGAETYRRLMPLCNRLIITYIPCIIEGDTKMPKISGDWTLVTSKVIGQFCGREVVVGELERNR